MYESEYCPSIPSLALVKARQAYISLTAIRGLISLGFLFSCINVVLDRLSGIIRHEEES